MSVTVKGATTINGTSTIAPHSSAAVGDLLVLVTGNYSTSISTPAGWTSAFSTSGSSTYFDFGQVFWKIAASGDLGAALTLNSIQVSYSGAVMLVVSGHDATTPLVVGGTGGSGALIAGPSITTTKASRRFAFFTQMGNSGAVTSFSGLTSGWTATHSLPSSGYHNVVLAYKNTTSDAAGTLTSPTIASNDNGGNVGINFAIQEGNASPVATITAPVNGFLDNRTSAVNVVWTYSDAESNAQTEYEVSYRIKDSGSAYTTVGNTNANTSHTFATGTFTDREDYELRVRVKDALAGWGNYSTVYFTGGPGAWQYDAEVISTSNTNVPLYTTYSQGFETDIDNWASNPAFGAYTMSTVARTTAKADTGSYSLIVTCPTAPASAPTWANTFITVQPKAVYEVTARVWVPTGVPPLELENVFFATSTYRTTTNNAWETIRATFVGADSGTAFVGVKTTGATTSGQVYYIDNMTIKQYELDGGTYELQVKNGTSNWSSTATFVVNTPPEATAVDVNPKYIGGNINVTWTPVDVNGNAQTKYQIRRRQRT